MKNWDADQWVKLFLGVSVFLFITTYIVGMFTLNHKTDEVNIQLRIRIVDLVTLIVMKLLVDSNKNKEDK